MLAGFGGVLPVLAGRVPMPRRPIAVLGTVATTRLGGTLVRQCGGVVRIGGFRVPLPESPSRLPCPLERPRGRLPGLGDLIVTRSRSHLRAQLTEPLVELP